MLEIIKDKKERFNNILAEEIDKPQELFVVKSKSVAVERIEKKFTKDKSMFKKKNSQDAQNKVKLEQVELTIADSALASPTSLQEEFLKQKARRKTPKINKSFFEQEKKSQSRN